MKYLLYGVGAGLVLFALLVVVLRYREGVEQDRRAAERLPEVRREAVDAVAMCESSMESLPSNLAMGTSKFEFYLLMDRPQLVLTLTDVVMPGISSRQLACGHAKTMLEIYVGYDLDTTALAKLTTINAQLARLDALEREVNATREAVRGGESGDELRARFVRLRRP